MCCKQDFQRNISNAHWQSITIWFALVCWLGTVPEPKIYRNNCQRKRFVIRLRQQLPDGSPRTMRSFFARHSRAKTSVCTRTALRSVAALVDSASPSMASCNSSRTKPSTFTSGHALAVEPSRGRQSTSRSPHRTPLLGASASVHAPARARRRSAASRSCQTLRVTSSTRFVGSAIATARSFSAVITVRFQSAVVVVDTTFLLTAIRLPVSLFRRTLGNGTPQTCNMNTVSITVSRKRYISTVLSRH